MPPLESASGPENAGNHERFLVHLRQSETTRFLIARHLVEKGSTVTIGPLKAAPTHERWQDYADDGDLTVNGRRVEVKRLGYDFTGRADWPFGSSFMVCAVHAWERAKTKPHLFFIVAKSGRHAAVVRGETQPQWTRKKHGDRRYDGYEQVSFYAPLDCVEWIDIPRYDDQGAHCDGSTTRIPRPDRPAAGGAAGDRRPRQPDRPDQRL